MDEPKMPTVRATVCHECHGQGATLRLVASTDGTRQFLAPCESCEGSGRLPGFVPPL